MHRFFMPRLMLPALALLVSLGCAGNRMLKPAAEEGSAQSITITAPPRHVVDLDRVAPDVKLVLAGVLNRVTGVDEPIQGLRFDPSGTHDHVRESAMDEGFGLNFIDITGYRPIEATPERGSAFMEGFVHLKDLVGRRASAYFAVKYSVTSTRVIVHQSATRMVPPYYPKVEAYFVPQSAFAGLPPDSFRTFLDLYLFSLANAVTMTPTEAERKAWEAYQSMSFWDKMTAGSGSTGDYYLMVFSMDWLPPESQLAMKIKDGSSSVGQDVAETAYVSWGQGCRVLIAGGQFNPDARGTLFTACVTYRSDGNQNNKPIEIAAFTNQKNYAPGDEQNHSGALVTKSGPKPGPIEGGRVFLNPENRKEAMIIQTRLKELNHYAGKIDGLFGGKSRSALKVFCREAGFGPGFKWTIPVQKALFKDTGR